jgi:hypothetical protein
MLLLLPLRVNKTLRPLFESVLNTYTRPTLFLNLKLMCHLLHSELDMKFEADKQKALAGVLAEVLAALKSSLS